MTHYETEGFLHRAEHDACERLTKAERENNENAVNVEKTVLIAIQFLQNQYGWKTSAPTEIKKGVERVKIEIEQRQKELLDDNGLQ